MNGITTPYGYFDPWALIAVALMSVAIAYIVRSAGRKEKLKGERGAMPFYSGNEQTAEGIKSKNMYWGFFRALERYYRHVERMHSGVVNDYVLSFVVIVVIIFAAFIVGGVLA